jgi:hypothetical protein
MTKTMSKTSRPTVRARVRSLATTRPRPRTRSVARAQAQRQILIDAVLMLLDTYGETLHRVVTLWQTVQMQQRRAAAHYVALGRPVPEDLQQATRSSSIPGSLDDAEVPNRIAWHDFRSITLMLATMSRPQRIAWTARYAAQLRRRIVV